MRVVLVILRQVASDVVTRVPVDVSRAVVLWLGIASRAVGARRDFEGPHFDRFRVCVFERATAGRASVNPSDVAHARPVAERVRVLSQLVKLPTQASVAGWG